MVQCRKIDVTCQQKEVQTQTNTKELYIEKFTKCIECPIEYSNFEIMCKLQLKQSEEKQLTFLIDTGAQLSFIKRGKINKEVPIDGKRKAEITGALNRQTSKTLGIVQCQLQIDQANLEQEFHLVTDKLNISTDGILVSNFLRKYQCKIDFEKLTIKIRKPKQENEIKKKEVSKNKEEIEIEETNKRIEENIKKAFIGRIVHEASNEIFEKENRNIKKNEEKPKLKMNNKIETIELIVDKATPMPDATAYTVAETFVTTIVCRHGIPEILVTDQGTNFMSNMFQEVCKILKIDHITTSAYRPQSNGQIERYHRSLAQYIKAFIETDFNNWDKWIPYALLVYNTTKQSSTYYTPHELVYGFNIEIPTNLKGRPTVVYNYDDYMTLLKNRLRRSHEIARENIIKSKERSKEYYDRNVKYIKFEVGDMVLVQNEVKSHKFEPPYLGPYPIVELSSDETSLIQVGRKKKRFHNNKLKLVRENENYE